MSKFTATPDEDLPQSLKDLKAYVASYAGLNGGDPESPIWFCAREPVGHVENYGRSVNPSKYQYFGSDSYCITPKEAEILVLSPYQGKYGHPGGVGFYRSQIGIATALIENPSDPEQVTSARRAVQLYQFMSKHRLVYSLSLSPIPNRHNAGVCQERFPRIFKKPKQIASQQCGAFSLQGTPTSALRLRLRGRLVRV